MGGLPHGQRTLPQPLVRAQGLALPLLSPDARQAALRGSGVAVAGRCCRLDAPHTVRLESHTSNIPVPLTRLAQRDAGAQPQPDARVERPAVRAALRKRLEPSLGEPSGPFAAGGLSIDFARRQVAVDGAPVELTATEYAVLYELAVHAPRVLTHQVLLQRVWGPERVGESWLLRNIVRRLRRKLGDDADNPRYVLTEPRVGYYLASGDAEEG